jgi:protein phosphatase PTC7
MCFYVCSLDVAENTSFKVEVDDLIIMGTDGLFDNLPKDQILQEVSELEVSDIRLTV